MVKVTYRMFNSKLEYENYCSAILKKRKSMEISDLHNKTSEEILSISGQAASVPVDVKAILEKLNISAIPFDFSEIEEKLPEEYAGLNILGALISNDDNAAILYSSKDKQDSHRMRFTIAHEIAHCCLHGTRQHIEFRIDGDLDDDEIAANTYAGELLIPEKALKDIIKQLLVPTITALADIFDVSINVMSERIKYLQLEDQIVGV